MINSGKFGVLDRVQEGNLVAPRQFYYEHGQDIDHLDLEYLLDKQILTEAHMLVETGQRVVLVGGTAHMLTGGGIMHRIDADFLIEDFPNDKEHLHSDVMSAQELAKIQIDELSSIHAQFSSHFKPPITAEVQSIMTNLSVALSKLKGGSLEDIAALNFFYEYETVGVEFYKDADGVIRGKLFDPINYMQNQVLGNSVAASRQGGRLPQPLDVSINTNSSRYALLKAINCAQESHFPLEVHTSMILWLASNYARAYSKAAKMDAIIKSDSPSFRDLEKFVVNVGSDKSLLVLDEDLNKLLSLWDFENLSDYLVTQIRQEFITAVLTSPQTALEDLSGSRKQVLPAISSIFKKYQKKTTFEKEAKVLGDIAESNYQRVKTFAQSVSGVRVASGSKYENLPKDQNEVIAILLKGMGYTPANVAHAIDTITLEWESITNKKFKYKLDRSAIVEAFNKV